MKTLSPSLFRIVSKSGSNALIALIALIALTTPATIEAQQTPYDDSKPVKVNESTSKGTTSGQVGATSIDVLSGPAQTAISATEKSLPKPPEPIPLDKPVGKEISMASPNAQKWFDAAMVQATAWDFPAGVKNKYGETITKEDFMKSIIWIESNGVHQSPHGKLTTSWVGAMGFGQLMPNTAKGMSIKAGDPGSNLKGSAKYIKEIFKSSNISQSTGMEKLLKACCGYNMGPYSRLLKKNWDQFKASAPLETVGYGIKLKMCLGFELTDWEKQKGAKLLGAKASQMDTVADDFYARTHGLLAK